MSVAQKVLFGAAGVGLLGLVWAAYTQPALQIALQSAFAACVGWVR